MQARIYITPDGMERLAKGTDTRYSWEFGVQLQNEDETWPDLGKNCLVVPQVEFKLPSRLVCAQKAKEKLEEQIQSIRAEAYREEKETQQRINDLLMLSFDAPVEVPAKAPSYEPDFPF